MKSFLSLLCVTLFSLTLAAQNESHPAFVHVRTIEIPDVPLGPYADHPTIDIKNRRIYATTQAHKSVKVFDLDTGKELHDIPGLGNPHSVLVRDDLDTVFITDGAEGQVKVFRGSDYQFLKAIKVELNADSTRYDPATKLLYVVNGGKEANLDYSLLSVIDTTKIEKLRDIKFPARMLEAIAFESQSPRSYVNLTDKDQVAVFDRNTGKIEALWSLTKGHKNIPIAVDEEHHRLLVGCRNTEDSGTIVIFDTRTGKEIDALPIAGWVDDIAVDTKRERIYASCGKGPDGVGSLVAFQLLESGAYQLIATTPTAPMAKAGTFVPELDLFVVDVPHNERTTAKVLVYKVQ